MAEVLSTITERQWEAIALLNPEYRENICSAAPERRKLISSMVPIEWQNVLDGKEVWNLESEKLSDYESLYIKVTNILKELNIDVKLAGYNYLRDAVIMMYNDSSYNGALTTRLLPEIANKFNAISYSSVDRDIRYVIDYAYHHARKDIFYKYFPKFGKKKKPTNSQAISHLVKYIKLYQ